MRRPLIGLVTTFAAALVALGATVQQQRSVTVHEWGTFTTVVGPDGRVIEWLPLGGPADLPCFVQVIPDDALLALAGKVAGVQIRYGTTGADVVIQIRNPIIPGGPVAASARPAGVSTSPTVTTSAITIPFSGALSAPNPFYLEVSGAQLGYEEARAKLRGTVRMETPVLYFYSPREESVNVSVDFPKGLITEWYPPALVVQPTVKDTVLRGPMRSAIHWRQVSILPNTKPTLIVEKDPSHYYPAREVDAAPVRVADKDEKFLFYRGVGSFQIPLTALIDEDGSILVSNIGKERIPTVVHFENRAGKVGYRILGPLNKSVRFEPLELDKKVSDLHRELEGLLVANGLYQKEARAMINTWRGDWFEQGERVLYILPQATVDSILPLTVTPAPTSVARVFVGRMEVFTDETLNTVARAVRESDQAVLRDYGRFLSPISERLKLLGLAGDLPMMAAVVSDAYRAYVYGASNRCP
jgi:hypothetical protein